MTRILLILCYKAYKNKGRYIDNLKNLLYIYSVKQKK